MGPIEMRKSEALYRRAKEVMPGGNTRHTVFRTPHQVYAERGEGCRIIDIDGNSRIDAVGNFTSLIHGYGWPRSTGGPMFYAEQMGLKTLCAKMEKLAAELGDPAFEPAHLLRALADEGLSVHALSRRDLPA